MDAKQGNAAGDGSRLATLELFVFGGSKEQDAKIAIA
jgi:hypothetical protein